MISDSQKGKCFQDGKSLTLATINKSMDSMQEWTKEDKKIGIYYLIKGVLTVSNAHQDQQIAALDAIRQHCGTPLKPYFDLVQNNEHLFDAAFGKNEVMLDILEKDDIDVEYTDIYGNTLLLRALANQLSEPVVERLITDKTRQAKNNAGDSPYLVAQDQPHYKALIAASLEKKQGSLKFSAPASAPSPEESGAKHQNNNNNNL